MKKKITSIWPRYGRRTARCPVESGLSLARDGLASTILFIQINFEGAIAVTGKLSQSV